MVNKKTILLFLIIICGAFTSIMTIQKVYHDKKIIDAFNEDILRIELYNRYENKFNYMSGLWLIPSGLFFIFLMAYLNIPSPKEAYQKLKRDLIKKIKKDLKKF